MAVYFIEHQLQNGEKNLMANESNQEIIAELRQVNGLDEPENPILEFFDKPIFHGEFGTTINIGTLLIIVLLFSIVIAFIIYRKKKMKRT